MFTAACDGSRCRRYQAGPGRTWSMSVANLSISSLSTRSSCHCLANISVPTHQTHSASISPTVRPGQPGIARIQVISQHLHGHSWINQLNCAQQTYCICCTQCLRQCCGKLLRCAASYFAKGLTSASREHRKPVGGAVTGGVTLLMKIFSGQTRPLIAGFMFDDLSSNNICRISAKTALLGGQAGR